MKLRQHFIDISKKQDAFESKILAVQTCVNKSCRYRKQTHNEYLFYSLTSASIESIQPRASLSKFVSIRGVLNDRVSGHAQAHRRRQEHERAGHAAAHHAAENQSAAAAAQKLREQHEAQAVEAQKRAAAASKSAEAALKLVKQEEAKAAEVVARAKQDVDALREAAESDS